MCYARLCRQMNYVATAHHFKDSCGGDAIGEIGFMKVKTRVVLELRKSRFLQTRIVIGIEAIDAVHGPSVGKKPACQMKADEAGRAGDNNGLAHFRIPSRPCSKSVVTVSVRSTPVGR